jgi:glutathione S-transferase
MSTYKLVIASKAYSSWSQRVWLLMRYFDIPFEEILISFEHKDWKERARVYSPTGLVPVLIDGDLAVWESLSILEYLAEKHSDKVLWPKDSKARALARSISSEMHAGFLSLRKFCPTNYRRALKPRATPLSDEVKADIARIEEIWSQMFKHFGGPYLCGAAFTIADAMYAPVVNRFYAYALSKNSVAEKYIATLRALPAWKEWEKGAQAESYHKIEMDSLN